MNRRKMLKKLFGGALAVPAAVVAGAELIKAKQDTEPEALPTVEFEKPMGNHEGITSYTWTTWPPEHPQCRCVIIEPQKGTFTAPYVSNTVTGIVRFRADYEDVSNGI